ncbi:MAG: class I SAM-dependent methyltransferase, partial [Dehalococcoidia bacterium]|nr:class I SAM-dependent methyltransferase [Dehalococcoidia bacterium]
EHGWTPYGVDVSPYATEYARRELGITVFTGTLDQVDLPPESLDLVTMLLTVEHLPDPKSVLRDLHKLVRPGGVLVNGTHDIEGLWPRVVGHRWRHFEMPEHVYLFSRRTLARMLSEVRFETFRVAETATLAAVTSARDGGVGLYAPVRLLRQTGLFV